MMHRTPPPPRPLPPLRNARIVELAPAEQAPDRLADLVLAEADAALDRRALGVHAVFLCRSVLYHFGPEGVVGVVVVVGVRVGVGVPGEGSGGGRRGCCCYWGRACRVCIRSVAGLKVGGCWWQIVRGGERGLEGGA